MEDHRRKRRRMVGKWIFRSHPRGSRRIRDAHLTAHVVDTGNRRPDQSIAVTFNVTVTPLEPAGTTADMIMRDGSNGNYEIYDLGNNAILAAARVGSGRLGVAGRGPRRLQRHRHLRHDAAQQRYRRIRDLRHQQQQHHQRRRHGPGRTGVAVAGFGDFQLARRRNRHADAQQQYRAVRDLRHQQQRDHLGGADGAGRAGMVGRGLRRFLDAAPTKPTC